MARWRKYGKDRLYVSTSSGQKVGWVDVSTGSTTLEVPAFAGALTQAVAAYCTQHQLAIPDLIAAVQATRRGITAPSGAGPSARAAAPAAADRLDSDDEAMAAAPAASIDVQVPVLPDVQNWTDLADNRPGQGVRAMADAELAAMRERSRLGTFLARAVDAKTQERSWRVGADGEEAVGARLEKLVRHGWHVLHSVPVGKGSSDMDHILIGPGGVYTINTKRHPNKSIWVGRSGVRVDGHRQPYLRNSRHEADRASRLLSLACGFPVIVKPALVFLTATVFPDVTIKERPADVMILDRMDIPGAFRRVKGRLTPTQVETIFEQARRSTTWTTWQRPRTDFARWDVAPVTHASFRRY